jgi:aminoglycoside phosphotransferase (APT) family kinase protein
VTNRTLPTDGCDGVDLCALAIWCAENEVDLGRDVTCTRVPGGRSNLTFFLDDAEGRRIVLRRPPLHPVPEGAHDVSREHRIVAALAEAEMPVPEVLGLCEDRSVLGAPFFLMAYVDGMVPRGRADVLALSPQARLRATEELVDAVARLHSLDVDRVGLGALARRQGYLERQLRRWSSS